MMVPVIIDVFLRNTTPYARWEVSRCSRIVQTAAEKISADINVALVPDKTPIPWTYPVGIRIMFPDEPRREYITLAWETRQCTSFVYATCYHLARVCRCDVRLTQRICVRGDIDLIRHIIERDYVLACKHAHTEAELVAMRHAPALLITRGYFDEALRVIGLVAKYGHKRSIVMTTVLVACYAVYMLAADITDADDAIKRIIDVCLLGAVDRETVKCVARCQRGDTGVCDQPSCHTDDGFMLLAALCGGVPKIINWCVNAAPAETINRIIDTVCDNLKHQHEIVSVETFALIMKHYTGSYDMSVIPRQYIDVI